VIRRVLAWFARHGLEVVVVGMALMVATRLIGLTW
jgi:hypothetical protein